MKKENINFPSKMCFSNDTRAKQLTNYFKLLVNQEREPTISLDWCMLLLFRP